jgi:sulfonate transport system substrate-binding protein
MNQIGLPKAIPNRALETLGLFIGGILFAIALDRWFARPAAHRGSTPLAQQARRLKQLKIGYPEGMTNLEVLRSQRLLEERLQPFGVQVTWSSYLSASALIEALSSGTIDFCGGGGTASIFSQAADHVFVRVAKEKYTSPTGEAILVREDSPIQTLADLKGKRIAFQKGSSAHFLTVQALQKAGIAYKDIEAVHLPPAEARAAFERGSVDAWAVWDPYYAAAELQGVARVLATGRDLVSNNSFYLATPSFVKANPRLVAALLDELSRNDAYFTAHRAEAVRLYSSFSGLEPKVVEAVLARRPTAPIGPLTPALIADQQRVADTYFQLGLIPKAITVSEAVWQPAATVLSKQP